MASSVPPVKNAAFSFDISLVDQSNTDCFKTSVTLAAGDIQVSKDAGSFANIGTLPTEIGTSGVLPVALTATEMDADRVTVRFHDAAGDQWQDALVTIYTAGQTLDTTDTAVDGKASQTSVDDLPTNSELATALAGSDDAVLAAIAALNNLSSAGAQAAAAAALLAYTAAKTTDVPSAGEIDTQLSSTHGAGLWGGAGGSGAVSTPITITDGTNPLDGVEVWVTTDQAGSNMVASGVTDALGVVTFLLDPGDYYVWKQLAGWNFTNPEDLEVT